jgi:hypothetical protein
MHVRIDRDQILNIHLNTFLNGNYAR